MFFWNIDVSPYVNRVQSESESHSVMSDPLQPHGLYNPWNSPGQNTGVGSLSLLQQIFPTKDSNQCFWHCRQILYHLSYQGSPKQSPAQQEFSLPMVSARTASAPGEARTIASAAKEKPGSNLLHPSSLFSQLSSV